MNNHESHEIAQLVLDVADVRTTLETSAALLKGVQEKLARLVERSHQPTVVQDQAGVHTAQD